MTVASHRWAILVATQHGRAAASGMAANIRLQEIQQLLARAKAVSDPLRTVALISEQFLDEWHHFAPDLPPYNVLVQPPGKSPLDELEQALMAIRARESDSSAVLIPSDHCAAVESSWVASAKEALRLAVAHHDTVYLLHDKPHSGPLAFAASTDMCSSTVVVGSTDSLLELSRGTRPTRLIDLSPEDMADAPDAVHRSAPDDTDGRINIVRIRSVDEYARLQRGQYTRMPATAVDVRV